LLRTSGPPIVPPNKKDVAGELRLLAAQAVRGPGCRRKPVVAPILEGIPAELVRSRLDHHVDNGAGHVAELRGVVQGLDADLFHGVRARLVRDANVDRLVRVDAVEREVVGLLLLAVDEGPPAAAQAVERPGIRLFVSSDL
jgi:hypothetical protein